jgi:holin-like protein
VRSWLVASGRLAVGLAVLAALQWLGGWIADAAHLPLPGSVVGMVLLTAAIELGVLPLAVVRDAAELLVRHLSLLFVPGGAALLLYLDVVRGAWVAVTLAATASLVVVLLVVGVVVQRLERAA